MPAHSWEPRAQHAPQRPDGGLLHWSQLPSHPTPHVHPTPQRPGHPHTPSHGGCVLSSSLVQRQPLDTRIFSFCSTKFTRTWHMIIHAAVAWVPICMRLMGPAKKKQKTRLSPPTHFFFLSFTLDSFSVQTIINELFSTFKKWWRKPTLNLFLEIKMLVWERKNARS